MSELSPAVDVGEFARQLLGTPLWRHQYELAVSPARFRCVLAGRQAGKSRGLAVIALHTAATKRNALILLVSAGEIASRRLLEECAMLAAGSPLLSGSVLDESKSQLTFSNGSRILSVPASQRQIRGWAADLLVVDEAAFIDDQIWRAAEPVIVAKPGSRVICVSTPWGTPDHWFRRNWQRGTDHPDEMIQSFHWPSDVSPLVDAGLVQHWRETWPAFQFQTEVLAEWGDDLGSYFTEAELINAVGDWEMVPPANGAQLGLVVGGVDWGYSTDANTIAVVAALPEADDQGRSRYWVPFVREEFRKPYADWIDDLVRMTATPSFPAGFSFSTLVCETNGCGMMPSQVLQVRLSELGVGHVVEPVATDLRLKETSYGWLKLLLQQNRLELPNYPPLLRQLRNLSFERLPSGGVRIHVPTHVGHDDLCSALCLAASAVMGNDLPPVPPTEVVEFDDVWDDGWEIAMRLDGGPLDDDPFGFRSWRNHDISPF